MCAPCTLLTCRPPNTDLTLAAGICFTTHIVIPWRPSVETSITKVQSLGYSYIRALAMVWWSEIALILSCGHSYALAKSNTQVSTMLTQVACSCECWMLNVEWTMWQGSSIPRNMGVDTLTTSEFGMLHLCWGIDSGDWQDLVTDNTRQTLVPLIWLCLYYRSNPRFFMNSSAAMNLSPCSYK